MVQDLDAEQLLTTFRSKLDDYQVLDNLNFLPEESNDRLHSYQLTYWDTNNTLKTLLVEVDQIKQKISFGPWGTCAMETVKF
ncbi:hypothetical protein [Mangrovimonas sp. TPBH4]|uniref:hypothetical protein n=1 Tax=Mangrovimonas sp. TPBH4 TaxID=1645914 RepID=UPI0006B4FAF2|nr:hypothetical protein [Mangrovimonas sp. TPBH4]